MQSHKPLEDYLIPALVFVEPTPGFEFGDVDYPKGEIRDDKLLGKMSEYAGKTEFKIPVTVTDEYDAQNSIAVRGVIQYQICDNAGQCFPPQAVEFVIGVGDGKGNKSAAAVLSETDIATRNDSKASVVNDSSIAVDDKMGKSEEGADQTATASTDDESNAGWLTRSQNYLKSLGYFGVLIMAFIGGMAMSFTLASIRLENMEIEGPQCVSKTLPDFFDRWQRLWSSK